MLVLGLWFPPRDLLAFPHFLALAEAGVIF